MIIIIWIILKSVVSLQLEILCLCYGILLLKIFRLLGHIFFVSS